LLTIFKARCSIGKRLQNFAMLKDKIGKRIVGYYAATVAEKVCPDPVDRQQVSVPAADGVRSES
jgi:hypothetical protein